MGFKGVQLVIAPNTGGKSKVMINNKSKHIKGTMQILQKYKINCTQLGTSHKWGLQECPSM